MYIHKIKDNKANKTSMPLQVGERLGVRWLVNACIHVFIQCAWFIFDNNGGIMIQIALSLQKKTIISMLHRSVWKWQTQVQVSPQSRGGCCRHQRGAVSWPSVSLQEDTLQRQTLLLHPGHGWHHLLVRTRLCWGAAGPTCWATRCLNVRSFQWKLCSLATSKFVHLNKRFLKWKSLFSFSSCWCAELPTRSYNGTEVVDD